MRKPGTFQAQHRTGLDRYRYRLLAIFVLCLLAIAACDSAPDATRTISIVSGSENETLEPIIQDWAQQNNYRVEMTYLGSLDIARQLQTGNVPYDGVWPANRLWIDYGDQQNIVRYDESMLRSPVVFGIKRSIAERLGWIGSDVFMEDILEATESGDVRFMMTSATQSNSGASFYLGALYAFAGNPDVLTMDDLEDDDVQHQIKTHPRLGRSLQRQ